mgnify:CR=1 FL=1
MMQLGMQLLLLHYKSEMAKTTLISFLIIALLPGCAALVPALSSAGAVRSEVKIQDIETRLENAEQILDYLIEQKNLQ